MQLIMNIAIAACYYFLASLGVALLVRVNGFISFSLGASAALAAFILLDMDGLGFISAISSVGSTLLLASLIQLGLFEPMRLKGMVSPMLMIASLGVYIVIVNTLSIIYGDAYRSVPGHVSRIFQWGTATITDTQILLLITTILYGIAVALIFHRTQMGRNIRAVMDNRELAQTLGISISWSHMHATIMATGCFIIAGMFTTIDVGAEPSMGMHLMLMGAVSAFLVGNSLPGTVLGACLLATVQQGSIHFFPSKWQDFVSYLVILSGLFIIPNSFQRAENDRFV